MKKMKNTLLVPVVVALLGGSVAANSNFMDTDYDKGFQEMQQYVNSMVDSHLTRAKLGNLGYPRVNVQDTNKSYIYEFDLAGVPKKDIKLAIDENNVLTLSGTKEDKMENKSGKYIQQEIFYGSFNRVMQLPDDIDQNKLETKYDNGILKLTIGKKEVKKPKSKILQIK
jgi:HSP20 family protein